VLSVSLVLDEHQLGYQDVAVKGDDICLKCLDGWVPSLLSRWSLGIIRGTSKWSKSVSAGRPHQVQWHSISGALWGDAAHRQVCRHLPSAYVFKAFSLLLPPRGASITP